MITKQQIIKQNKLMVQTNSVKASNGWDLCHGWDSRRTRTSGCLTLLDARRRACIPPIVLQETIPGPSYGRSATNGAYTAPTRPLGKERCPILAKFRLH